MDKIGLTLKFIFALITVVLLMNMIIAVVSNKCTEVKQNIKNVSWVQTLCLITGTENLLLLLGHS